MKRVFDMATGQPLEAPSSEPARRQDVDPGAVDRPQPRLAELTAEARHHPAFPPQLARADLEGFLRRMG